MRSYATTPAHVGEHAPDYLIRTDAPWNFALDLSVAPTFNATATAGWSAAYAFDDGGRYAHTVRVQGRRVPHWGYWRGSNITAPPPISPPHDTPRRAHRDRAGAPRAHPGAHWRSSHLANLFIWEDVFDI